MTITESRLKGGTLGVQIGAGSAVQFAKQTTEVTLDPKTDEQGDALETLDGSTVLPEDETTWTLKIGAVQDFDDPAGFVAFCLENKGELATVTWTPNAAGVSYEVTARVRPVPIGGEVNARLTTDAEWPVQGDPIPTYAP